MNALARQYLLHWVVPKELQTDLAQRHRALRIVLFGLAVTFWAPVFAPIYHALGSSRGGLMITAAGAACLTALYSLRWTKSLVATGNLISLVVFLILVAIACITGGISAPSPPG